MKHNLSTNYLALYHVSLYIYVVQRFSNFFQVGTTFISQNVLRTNLLLNVLTIC
jgi:hypothetical protein